MKNVSVLGATGSIGVSTLSVISLHKEKFNVVALSANTQIDRLFTQCQEFSPKYAVMRDESCAQKLSDRLKKSGLEIEVLSGEEGLCFIASMPDTDYVMAAIVGAAGLTSTLAAAKAGKRVLLANKESLVMSGRLFMDTVAENNAELLPIDSEHNAIFQCMPQHNNIDLKNVGIEKILLTGSGGPFRTVPVDELHLKTPAQAIAHPNWDMGKKISVDSATMMNKGLEVIEACWLFNAALDDITVVLHPQSIIHSMVEYSDGSILAQLGQPDMRTPISYSLAWPERMMSGVKKLDLFEMTSLDFEQPDMERYPCLRLAKEAMKTGGTATTVLNAANEIAVDAFLNSRVAFTSIANVVEHALSQCSVSSADTLQNILDKDAEARAVASQYIDSNSDKNFGALVTNA